MLPLLTGTLWTAALPSSAKLWQEKRKKDFAILAEKSFHVVYMVLIPLTVYFFLFAEPWIRLIGGKEYLDAGRTMRLLLLAVILIGFSNIVGGQMLIPMGWERDLFRAEVIGMTVNLILNGILIPLFAAPGAVIGTTVSEIIVTVAAVWMVRKQVKVRIFQRKTLLRMLAGCVTAGLVAIGTAGIVKGTDVLRALLSILVFSVVFSVTMFFHGDSFYTELFAAGKKFCPAFVRKFWNRVLRVWVEKTKLSIRRILFRAGMVLFPDRTDCCCPCCGIQFGSFTRGDFTEHPEIYNPARYESIRQDVLCPVCCSLSRHRIQAKWCDAHLAFLQGSDILYFAPENSMILWMKRNHVSCRTADLYQKADLCLDIQKTGLPDESCDVIFCNHVLEHVADFRAALRELYRILRLEGLLICSFPIDPKVEIVEEEQNPLSGEEWIRRFGQIDHLRVFGRNAAKLLEEAGFSVARISGNMEPPEILPVTGPADYDFNCLFECRKQG